jgi:hypothetical protein
MAHKIQICCRHIFVAEAAVYASHFIQLESFNGMHMELSFYQEFTLLFDT